MKKERGFTQSVELGIVPHGRSLLTRLKQMLPRTQNPFTSSRRHSRVMPSLTAGFTILEMVIYAAVLGILVVGVVQAVLSTSSTFTRLKATRAVTASAAATLDRFVFEVRDARSIDSAGSVFDTHPGNLAVVKPGGSAVVFSLADSSLQVDGGSGQETLTGPAVSVTNLVFRSLTSEMSDAVRIEMTLSAPVGDDAVTQTFYTTALLRGSYAAQ